MLCYDKDKASAACCAVRFAKGLGGRGFSFGVTSAAALL
jgi:hypothetical protein